jgi:hypothetical protein
MFSLLIFVLIASSLFSQTKTEHNANDVFSLKEQDKKILFSKCDDFFKLIINGKYREAFSGLLTGSLIGEKSEQLTNLIDQTKRASELYGEMKSYELVNTEAVSPSLARLRYLSLHTDYPMRWLLTFYKSPEKGWVVINVKFDDVTESFFQD